ncbi:nucleoside-triphosphatase [Hyaloraphidium curvatum]|nr:nucleoside-triphosphatase [Hyaloraphidium curvatum]
MLAHVNWEGKARVGRYGVDPGSLDGVLAEELGPRPDGHAKIDAYVVDEIGKMEVLSPRFVEAVGRVLDGPVPVLATVGQKGGGFIAEAKRRPDVAVLEVDARNRDGLPQILADRLLAGA